MEREFKDSGIEWIGRIPSEWKMHPLAIYFAENNRPNSDLGSVKALQFKYGEIVQKPNNGKELTDKDRVLLEKYTVVLPDDIVVNGLNLNYDLKSLRVAKVREEGIITSAYIVLRPRNYANASYYNYYLKALDFQKIFHGMGVGIRLTLSYNELRSMLIPVPSKDEQQHIADYLDKKCGEIDELIALQEQMIAQLTDYKQSVITEAVTKGLNPNAELVPTGIDWIGYVPKGWKVCKLKYLCNYIKDGTHFSPNTIADGYPYITATDVRGLGIDYANAKKVSKEVFLELQKAGCQPHNGDILLVKDGATTGRVGMMIDDTECVLLSSVAMLSPNKRMANKYLMYVLMSDFMQSQMKLSMAGAALPRITLTKLMNFNCLFFPLSEQNAIVVYLDEKCSEIDSLIYLKQQKIEVLKEYKKSIIYEYVTGKKELI